MAKYAKYARKPIPKPEQNPIWRGIGCLLIIIVPVMAYALMMVTLKPLIGSGIVPVELRGYVQFPPWANTTPVIRDIAGFIGSINDLYLKATSFIVILILMTAFSSLAYTMVFQVMGPPRYSAMDAPPPPGRSKKSSR
jgi:hypothetical protein